MSTTLDRPTRRRPRASRPKTPRVIGLTRFSQLGGRDKENLLTLDIQHERIESACESDELDLVGIIDEPQVSGMLPLERRRGLSEALRMIEDNEADVLMVAYFDRAFRSMKVKAEVIDRVEDAGGRLKALDTGAISHATTGEWLTSSIHGLFAEWYGRSAGDRAGAAQKETIMKRGVPISNTVPPGYRRRDDKTYELHEPEAEVMREAFRMRAGGATHLEVHDYLAEHDIAYTVSGVRNLLKNRVYRGRAKFGDHVHEHAHDALIDEPTFRRAQRARGTAGRKTGHPMLLAKLDVLVCGTCGSRMSASVSKPRPGKEYHYYRCGAEHGMCSNRCSVSEITSERETLDFLKQWARERKAEGRASVSVDVQEAHDALAAAQMDLDNAVAGYAAAKLMDEPSAIAELDRLREQRDTREHDHDRLRRAADRSVRVTFDDVDSMTFDERRDAIVAVLARIVCRPGRGTGRLKFETFPESAASDAV